ncbi:AAA family ATPase [Pseudomonas pudica]|uniref:AAA family ATPase n=1 Tax=Pseudomonas pudica TaxID=272772 RepID=UPI00320A66F4
MEVSVKNFGTIRNADVSIGGLTVITGENDTGKSTIGKILFSLVKAVARYEEDLEEVKEVRVTNEAQQAFFTLRRIVNIADNEIVRDMFHPRKVYGAFKLDKNKAYDERKELIAALSGAQALPRNIGTALTDSLNKIMAIMSEPDDTVYAMSRAVRKSFFSEFKDEIIQRGVESKCPAKISISDGASKLVDITWEKEGEHRFAFVDTLGYADATYVDSPAIIQYHQLVRMAKTQFENDPSRFSVPLHVKDLANKLTDSKYAVAGLESLIADSTPDTRFAVANLLGGMLSYDDDASDFMLDRNGYKISSNNIASGIKAIGILDMLVTGGNIRRNSLLVLDEPEVNLHPKWQVAYCEIVCELVSAGVDIIVTTHSPYIVEALRHHADKAGIENKFYLAQKVSECESEFRDISPDISIAIDALAAPLMKLNDESVEDFLN